MANGRQPRNGASRSARSNTGTTAIRGEVKMIELVQQLEYLDLDNFKSILASKVESNQIQKYAYIVHDKDRNESGGKTPDHIHCIMKFRYSTRLNAIRNWFRVQPQNLQKIRGAWLTACRYLVHMNHPDKYQYDVKQVVANFEYATECQLSTTKNDRGRDSVPKAIRDKLIKIANGVISEKDIVLHFTPQEYDKYKRNIENYIDFANKRKQIELTSKKRRCENLYIYGKSGLGKTRLAKKYCIDQYNDYFLTGSSNDPLDGYKGEKSIIFDDIRPENMSLCDYLKLTDPYNSSLFKCRYRNKVVKAEALLMTTPFSPNTYLNRMCKDMAEDPVQFYRRHQSYLNVKPDVVDIYRYDEATGGLAYKTTTENIFSKTTNKQQCSDLEDECKVATVLERWAMERRESNINTQSTESGGSIIDEHEKDVIQHCIHFDTPISEDASTIPIIPDCISNP